MAYDVKQHFDHFTMRNAYGNGGYNNGFRGRREAPDADGKLPMFLNRTDSFDSRRTILGQLLFAMDPV